MPLVASVYIFFFKRFAYFYFMCQSVRLYASFFITFVLDVCGGEKGHQKLELPMVVSHHMDLGNQIWVLQKSSMFS